MPYMCESVKKTNTCKMYTEVTFCKGFVAVLGYNLGCAI